jgi:hypothetical protein
LAQSQRTTPPRQLQLTPPCQAEFIICDQTIEVDNIYLKSALGLGDFRLQSFEAIQKWFQVVRLALNYLQYQQALTVVKTGKRRILADFIHIHRQEHAIKLLHTVAERVLACGENATFFAGFGCCIHYGRLHL